jgi:hypothetical protein
MVTALAQDRYAHSTYLVRRKIFKLFGNAFHIYDPVGQVAFYSRQKAFRLKEDLRLYTGEDMRTEILSMRARRVLDFGVTFDVFDSITGAKVGALRRKGFKSMIQDEWTILDPDDREIGLVQEDSVALALIRRFLSNLVPQTWNASLGGALVAVYQQHFNPFVLKITIDFSADVTRRFDRRMGIAVAVLLNAIEGRQQ